MYTQEQRLHTMLALMLMKYGEQDGENYSVVFSRDLYDQLPDATRISTHSLPDGSGVVLRLNTSPDQEG